MKMLNRVVKWNAVLNAAICIGALWTKHYNSVSYGYVLNYIFNWIQSSDFSCVLGCSCITANKQGRERCVYSTTDNGCSFLSTFVLLHFHCESRSNKFGLMMSTVRRAHRNRVCWTDQLYRVVGIPLTILLSHSYCFKVILTKQVRQCDLTSMYIKHRILGKWLVSHNSWTFWVHFEFKEMYYCVFQEPFLRSAKWSLGWKYPSSSDYSRTF